jgi:hypothetical protein
MSEMKTVPGVIDIIHSITSNRETGRLEINSSGTYGTLLFSEGKLVDARLGSLSGFQAVNAAVALRDVELSFDHVVPASHLSTINPSERVVLKRFFGIEAAEMEEPSDHVEPDWNEKPEQVVPLTEVAEVAPVDLEETPTVEVEPPIRSRPIAGARSFPLLPRVAFTLVLLLCLAVGVIALRSKMKAQQQAESVPAASVPTMVASESTSVPASAREVKPSDANVQDLTGEWRIINTVEKTAYKSFDNMKVGFRLTINQSGKQFTAKGEKFSENGQPLPAASRTPIQVTGSIDGDKVVATFVEDGRSRRTNGRFVWKLQNGGDGLAGTFVSSAANTSGRSAVTKQH